MNRLTWLTAVDGSTHDKIGFHVATRMNSSTMQNFYDSEAHFKNWLCKAAREYPGGAAAFYVGFASMHEEGWFKGAPMGIGDFLMFQAAIPVSFDT